MRATESSCGYLPLTVMKPSSPSGERFVVHWDPNPHLPFGGGPHDCVGAVLARLELRCLLMVLARRVSCITVTGRQVRRHSNFLHGHEIAEVTVVADVCPGVGRQNLWEVRLNSHRGSGQRVLRSCYPPRAGRTPFHPSPSTRTVLQGCSSPLAVGFESPRDGGYGSPSLTPRWPRRIGRPSGDDSTGN